MLSLNRPRQSGISRLEYIFIVVFILIVVAILQPVYVRGREAFRQRSCKECNLQDLVTALQMYCEDNHDTLPSSILRSRSEKWDPKTSAEFCAELGPVPPPSTVTPKDAHWVQVLWSHIKDKGSIWCPSDPVRSRRLGFYKIYPKPQDLVSYIYRPAIDRAWFDAPYPVDSNHPDKGMKIMHFRKLSDFPNAENQIIFFEKSGWHWGMQSKGWRDGVHLDACALDGHCTYIKLKDAVGCDAPETSDNLANIMQKGGEPLWYNHEAPPDGPATDQSYNEYDKGKRGIFYDPRRYVDNLQ